MTDPKNTAKPITPTLSVSEQVLPQDIAALAAAGESASVIGRIEAGTKGCDVTGAAGSWGSAAAWTASHDG